MHWLARMAEPGHPSQLVLGPLVWAAWFVVMYASLSVGCSLAPPPVHLGSATWINGILLILTLLVALVLLAGMVRCWRTPSDVDTRGVFVARVAGGIYLFSAVATLMGGMPAVVLPPCL